MQFLTAISDMSAFLNVLTNDVLANNVVRRPGRTGETMTRRCLDAVIRTAMLNAITENYDLFNNMVATITQCEPTPRMRQIFAEMLRTEVQRRVVNRARGVV